MKIFNNFDFNIANLRSPLTAFNYGSLYNPTCLRSKYNDKTKKGFNNLIVDQGLKVIE